MSRGRILVTGASSGIGRACAIRLARLGFAVSAGVRDPAAGEAVRAAMPGIDPVILDVTDPASIEAALAVIGDEPLAGLVNNAGIAAIGPLELLPVASWRRQFEVNVFGLVAVTQACLPGLRRGRGRIVNVGSIAGQSALPGTGAYDSSKFAVEGISDALRLEVVRWGIRVSVVEAGAVATAIWDKTLRELDETVRRAPADRRDLYAGLLAKVKEETVRSAEKALPADAVAKVVEHAITAQRPKRRYLVGADARFWRLLNLLPDAWRDRLILSGLGA